MTNLVSDDRGSQPTPTVNTQQSALPGPDVPGRRLANPLSQYASVTYQISLFMVTPAAYSAYIDSGRKNISDIAGAYLVAQSGGINDNSAAQRAPGFEFDYFIDNLKIKTSTNGKSTQSASNVTEVAFDIIEPNGFSFISRLTKASQSITRLTKQDIAKNGAIAARQFFIICLKFLGYDANGNPIRAEDVIERYYDIYVISLKFKIDGKHTTYNIRAATVGPQSGFGNKNGRINAGVEIQAGTVEDALLGDGQNTYGLLRKINDDQRKMAAENGTIPNVYDVEFIGDGIDALRKSSFVMQSDMEKMRWAMSVPGLISRTTNAANQYVNVKAAPRNDIKLLSFVPGTSILQAINSIISRSTYLTDALKQVYDSTTENNSKSDNNQDDQDGNPNRRQSTARPIRWYNVSTRISNIQWDPKRRDWAYKITYVIQPYETPNVVSAFVGKTSKYYGPHKRYEYWFTGQNTEILSYEQTLNSAWYMADYNPSDDAAAKSGNVPYPSVQGQRQDQDRSGKLGIGMEAQNSYLTSLFSPGDFVTARMRILGDPDYLMQDSANSPSQIYQKFYGADGFTINPNGGQVFLEIDFREAIDYDYENNDGLMSINDSILMWEYPPEVKKIVKGISYMLLSVESEFSRGSFTQNLYASINPMTDLIRELRDGGRTPPVSQTTARSDSLPIGNPYDYEEQSTPQNTTVPPPQPKTTAPAPQIDSRNQDAGRESRVGRAGQARVGGRPPGQISDVQAP